MASPALFVILGVQVFDRDGRGHGAGLAQPYARPFPVVIDEDHAGRFEGGANGGDCPLLRGERAGLNFKPLDRRKRDL